MVVIMALPPSNRGRACCRLEDVVKEIPHESLSLVARGEQLGQQIRFVAVSIDIGCPPLVSGCAFEHKMIANTLTLLLQC